jgi:hypothetical protein
LIEGLSICARHPDLLAACFREALVECEHQTLVGIISFGVLALSSASPTAGIVGAVPVSQVALLVSDQVPAARRNVGNIEVSTRTTAFIARGTGTLEWVLPWLIGQDLSPSW